jgi:hypothetical protein
MQEKPGSFPRPGLSSFISMLQNQMQPAKIRTAGIRLGAGHMRRRSALALGARDCSDIRQKQHDQAGGKNGKAQC